MSSGNCSNYMETAYVVLLGDVGTGKSTLVEKLTDEKGRSSNATESATRSSKPFWTRDGSLLISDTPGANAMKDKLEHNLWIAQALNLRPVSKIFIVVKAETRIDTVVDNVRKYADRLLDLPMDIVGVIVTHMDMVEWSKQEFVPFLVGELGIDVVVCSSLTIPQATLIQDIQGVCKETHDLTIDHENFLKVFKIHNIHRKILLSTRNEVQRFQAIKDKFAEARKDFSGNDVIDLVFEFQAWMGEQIIDAQKRISEEHKFTFYGDGAANEAGHVANMTNQLRMVLYNVRTEALRYQAEHGVTDLRQCPHCGLVWAKVEGCEGATTCGNRPSAENDLRDNNFSEMATFTFSWGGLMLSITKSGSKRVKTFEKTSNFTGCGQSITWTGMAKVSVPSGFTETSKLTTDDVKVLPAQASGFNVKVDAMLADFKSKMQVPDRPSAAQN